MELLIPTIAWPESGHYSCLGTEPRMEYVALSLPLSIYISDFQLNKNFSKYCIHEICYFYTNKN